MELALVGCAIAVAQRGAAFQAVSFHAHSTVTDFAKLRGLSTSVPRTKATW